MTTDTAGPFGTHVEGPEAHTSPRVDRTHRQRGEIFSVKWRKSYEQKRMHPETTTFSDINETQELKNPTVSLVGDAHGRKSKIKGG